MKKYTSEEKLKIITDCLLEVAPEKMIDELTIQTSITNDLVLDSIEIMDLLIKIRETMKNSNQDEQVDIDRLLVYLFANTEDVLVKVICDFMDELV